MEQTCSFESSAVRFGDTLYRVLHLLGYNSGTIQDTTNILIT